MIDCIYTAVYTRTVYNVVYVCVRLNSSSVCYKPLSVLIKKKIRKVMVVRQCEFFSSVILVLFYVSLFV